MVTAPGMSTQRALRVQRVRMRRTPVGAALQGWAGGGLLPRWKPPPQDSVARRQATLPMRLRRRRLRRCLPQQRAQVGLRDVVEDSGVARAGLDKGNKQRDIAARSCGLVCDGRLRQAALAALA